METQRVDSNGIRINVLTDGPSDGPPVLLIHGFPETSYEWRKQIPALVDAGYRVIVPDTRGYGDSDKPPGPVSRHTLAADMVGVLDRFDVDEVALVGHDWGGIIGFKVVIDWPERISSVALMDTLCTVWTPFAVHGFWFKARPLPEHFYAEYHEQFIETIFTGQSDPELPGWPDSPWNVSGRRLTPNRWATDEDVEVYKKAFSDPGSHAAAISYYRHALPFHRMRPDDNVAGGYRCERLTSAQVGEVWRRGLDNHPWGREFMEYGPEDRHKRFEKPALWMYGNARLAPDSPPSRDTPSGNPFFDQFPMYFPDLTTVGVPGAGHFFPEEAPEITNQTLLEFLAGAGERPSP